MNEPITLPVPIASRYGAPVITRVDAAVFRRRYFTHCLQCGFCPDWCCQHGVDVDAYHHARIVEHAEALQAYTGIPRRAWFSDEIEPDPEVPGGKSFRTSVVDGACVFLRREGRGCMLHAFCVEADLDHRELKSMVDCLFPITFLSGTLTVSDEVGDGSLVCLDTGPTVYDGGREELRYYFGDGLLVTLDEIAARVTSPSRVERDPGGDGR